MSIRRTDAYQMAPDQQNKLAAYGGLSRDYLFLLSWTTTGSVGPGRDSIGYPADHQHRPGVVWLAAWNGSGALDCQIRISCISIHVNSLITEPVIRENLGFAD